MTDPYLASVVVVLVVAPILVAVAVVLDRWLTPPEAQPLVDAQPAIAPRCQAAHCGNAAFTPAPHVDGTDMWVCPGDLERGLREGWLVQDVAS
jgi:hypothetical protein